MFLKVKTTISFQEKKVDKLFWSCLGAITSELWFEMLCSLINLKKSFISVYIWTVYIWIVTVQYWTKTSPANANCPKGTLNFKMLLI